ncbi:MAG: DEAD/DEAH box helicase [Acetobacteraceae bacterium]
MGYRHPTPIQAQAIPTVLMGRDVMGVAQTGTGKTASFTLPMMDILTGSRARARMPRSLILEPTRELALQVAENFVQYGKYLKLTHALIIGGESMSDQKDVLTRGVDVLIATPGRLIDMFERGSILLSDARLLVIDEADRMLDMGFIPDVERIVQLLPANRQTLFFSATMGPEIRRLADAFLNDPKEITVSRPASVATTITEGLALVAEHDKREALRRLIRTQNVQNALIFCNKKIDVDILYKSLTKHQFSVGALHGDLAQTVRFTTLEKFKANELKLLVCSDVAARGIDIGGLSHVFNFDVPHHAEDYVHRIGRTGRAGLEGHAFTIAKPDDKLAIEAIEKLIGHPIPPMIVEGLDPVDWSEGDSRKRRGRGKKAAEPRKSERSTRERAPRMRGEETEARAADRPRRERAPARADAPASDRPPSRERAPVRERDRPAARPDDASRERVARRDDRHRDDMARDDRARDDRARDDRRRDDRSREDRPRDERGRDDYRRDRYRRDDDLGPPVLGFGDDVPAFMLLRTRSPRHSDTTDTEA